MNDVKLWALALCAASMLSAMLEVLAPQTGKRPLRFLMQLLLLLCILAPANGALRGLSGWRQPPVQNEYRAVAPLDTGPLYKRQLQTALQTLCLEKLAAQDIFPKALRIDITVSDNAVTIDGAAILLEQQDAQRLAAAQQALHELLGTAVLAELEQEVG